jgi:hypothetical protein
MAQPHIEIAVTNPTPGGGQPNALRNEVWRSESAAAGSYVRIASNVPTGQPTLYRDYQVGSGKTYWYFVRTYFDNTTTGDSAVGSQTVTWDDYTWLGLPDGTYPVQVRWNPRRSERFKVESRLLEFDGRVFPLGYAGAGSSEDWELGYTLQREIDASAEQAIALKTLVDTQRGKTLLWRDPMGNLVYCWVDGYDRDLLKNPRSDVSFRLSRVDFTPAV